MKYLHWNEQTITDFSEKNISDMYDRGYVFTRIGKGVMHQTRSVRIDLIKFELSSENRRILKRAGDLAIAAASLPFVGYDFTIGKLAKDFYEEKFGPGMMSAQKVKEVLTDTMASNFNVLLRYNIYDITAITEEQTDKKDRPHHTDPSIGYAICYENAELLHYSYPFYDLNESTKDMGLGMMVRAIQWAVENNKKYAYLGSLQRPGDTYKLQFSGLEWFDGGPDGSNKWSTDMEKVKKILSSAILES